MQKRFDVLCIRDETGCTHQITYFFMHLDLLKIFFYLLSKTALGYTLFLEVEKEEIRTCSMYDTENVFTGE